MIGTKVLTLPAMAGLVSFSVVSFLLLLAAYGSIVIGKAAEAYMLVTVISLFAVAVSVFLAERTKGRSSGHLLLPQLCLGVAPLIAIPCLYSVSGNELALTSALISLSVYASGLCGWEIYHIFLRSQGANRSRTAWIVVASTAFALFWFPLVLHYDSEFFRLGAAVGLLSAISLLALMYLVKPGGGLLRTAWWAVGFTLCAVASAELILVDKIENYLEQIQLIIR